MKTYLEQLQSKYDDPRKAYLYYSLSKTLLHHVSVSENSPEEIKDILKLQNILNDYCDNFIENESYTELHEFFGFSEKQQLIDYMFTDQNFEKLHFLEITYNFRDSVLSGEYQARLKENSNQFTWSTLNDLILKENNNNPKLLDTEDINLKLNKIINDFALVSIAIGNVKIDNELIDKTYQSLEQLSIVLNCNKKHIGLNKLTLCLDCNSEIDLYSGSIGRYKSKHLILCAQSSVMNELFAHEWFHFIDIVTAEYKYRHIYGEDIDRYRLYESKINKSFKQLLDNSFINRNNSSVHIDHNKIFSHIQNIIEKYSKLNTLIDAKALTELIEKKIIENDFYHEDLIQKIQKLQTNKNNGLVPYILSEISLLTNRDTQYSLFGAYAFMMDKSMKKMGLLHEDDSYSINIEEVAARIFESYVDYKLEEKKISNIISQPNYTFHTPQREELQFYIKSFDSIINDIKNNFNEIYPISNNNLLSQKILSLRDKNNKNYKLSS